MSHTAIRTLQPSDRAELLKILDNTSFLQAQEQILLYLEAHRQRRLLGYFAEGKLQAFCGIYFFPQRPWASIPFLQVSGELGTAQRLSALLTIVDQAFAQIEEQKNIRIFMANEMKNRSGHLNAKLHPLAKKLPRLHQYVFISEGFVKAGERPNFDYQWNLMGQKVCAVDVGFVSATRKSPYDELLERK